MKKETCRNHRKKNNSKYTHELRMKITFIYLILFDIHSFHNLSKDSGTKKKTIKRRRRKDQE